MACVCLAAVINRFVALSELLVVLWSRLLATCLQRCLEASPALALQRPLALLPTPPCWHLSTQMRPRNQLLSQMAPTTNQSPPTGTQQMQRCLPTPLMLLKYRAVTSAVNALQCSWRSMSRMTNRAFCCVTRRQQGRRARKIARWQQKSGNWRKLALQ